jgi:two-component system, OmpR family, response regulator
MPRPTVIVVEDEADLRGMICTLLSMSGLDARGVGDAAGLDQAWAERPADILLLDVNLPGENGFLIAGRMRLKAPVGIIMLTAREDTGDYVAGLESGADVYLVKPVELPRILAAIRALLRRLGRDKPNGTAWLFAVRTWTLTAPNGATVSLTATEFSIMDVLLASPDEPANSAEILKRLNKRESESSRRNLDAAISRLRRKVEKSAGVSLPVKSAHGIGYAFIAPWEKV